MLQLCGIRAGYGDFAVLRNVDLTVPDGSVVALLGANGAGKTSLLRVASGLLPPAAGEIRVNGENYGGRPPHSFVAAGVCHVPEGRGIFPSLTVAENLRQFSARGRDAETVERALAAFPKLGTRLAQVAGTMSGGEQQMLALARAYARQPSVVLLDEVSMGLAPIVVDEIFDSLHRLRAEGVAMLVVEQYVSKALSISDYVYVLSRGSLVFAGEPAELGSEDVFSRYFGAAQASA